MNMFEYWKNAFAKNYANFNGRARRSEYWYYTLMNVIILISLVILFTVCSTANLGGISWIFIGLYFIFIIATIIPTLAVLVRRLHDVGKSGWFFFVYFIPLAGPIWLLVLLFTQGEQGENAYGPDPKGQVSINDDALDSHLTS